MTSEPPAKKKCLGVDCENDAGSLQCPTCLKLGLKDSFFCSQDCFKRSWVSSNPICFMTETLPTSHMLISCLSRAPTSPCTSRKVISFTTLFLRKQSHQTQQPATTTRFPTIPSPALSDPSTRCPSTEPSPSPSLTQPGGK